MIDRIGDFAACLSEAAGEAGDLAFAALRAAEMTGRPVGDKNFIASLEHRLGRALSPRKRGPNPAAKP
jgi:hypothetical protein